MTSVFDSIHNHHERAVFAAVLAASPRFDHLLSDPLILADVACIALNKLPARYIQHEVDYLFYLSDRERVENDVAVTESVEAAFQFVQAKMAMRARR